MTETSISKQIRVAASERGAILHRNNSGGLPTPTGFVYFGLGNVGKDKSIGSSDLIGWIPVTITADMVGRKIAKFIAVETKTSNGRTELKRLARQRNFIEQIIEAGGAAGFATSVDDLKDILK